MLPKKKRINRSLFLKITEKGRYLVDKNINLTFIESLKLKDFLLKTEKNPNLQSKFSFVVSKKVAKKATERNLLKRRGYYIIRKNLKKIKDNYFMIFFMKPGVAKLSFKELEGEILGLLKKGKFL